MDPSYPGRPDHPDFTLLSKLVLAMDDNPEGREDFPAFLATIADPESLVYLANGRALMALDTLGKRPSAEWVAAFGAIYLDGFLLGVQFAKEKAAQALKAAIEQAKLEDEGGRG